MVCRYSTVVLTTVATFVSVVSLRDAEDITMSFGVDEMPVHTWDEVSRSLDQAIGSSEEQRATLLQEVASVVQSLRQQGSNASTYINGSNAKILNNVLTILDTHIFGAMDAAHDNDEEILMRHVNVTMRSCNQKLAKRLSDGGDVYKVEAQVSESRQRHLTCRAHEVVAWKEWRKAIDEFDTFRSSLVNRTLHQFPDDNHRTMQEFDIFFLTQDPFFEWYEKHKELYVGYYRREEANETNYKGIKGDCNDNQTHFEAEYCIFSFARNNACNEQVECYQNATDEYTKLIAKARVEEKTRKDSWQAGNLIIDNLKCLMGTASCDVTTTVDYSRYTLDIPEPVENGKCTPEQLYEASPERSPGGQFFVENEYNSETVGFQARPRTVLIECSAEPSMPEGRGDGCSDTRKTDIRGNDCSFYNENPTHCGVYDTSEYTAGCACCKCWRSTTQCDGETTPEKKVTPTLYTPGTYGVFYDGKKEAPDMMIDCDGKVTQTGLITDRLRWDGLEVTCVDAGDATMYIKNTRGEGNYQCLRREGEDLKGTHFNAKASSSTPIEYRFSEGKDCDNQK